MKTVTILAGYDGLQKKSALQRLTESVDKKNISVYYAVETDTGTIFSECLQDSLFSISRTIIVKNVDSLKDREKKRFEEALDGYADHVNTDLSLIVLTEELPAGIEEKILKTGEIIRCRKMYSGDLSRFIINELDANGIKYDRDLPDFILSLANDDEWETENMIQSLIYYVQKDKTAGIEDARALLSRAANMNIFDLLDGIFLKDVKKSITALSDLRRADEPVTHIIYMIMRSAKNLWTYLSLNKSGTAGASKMKQYEMKIMKGYSGKSDLKFAGRIFSLCMKLELTAKTMKDDFSFFELENFIYTMN